MELEHSFSTGLGPFQTWSGEDVDADNVEIGEQGLRLHVDDQRKGAAVALPTPFTFGRIAVRCRLPKGLFKGICLLWPADGGWPPEIDFYEIGAMWSGRQRCNQTLHWREPETATQMKQTNIVGDFSQWKTIVCNWRPGHLHYQVLNGGHASVYSHHVPDVPMKLHLKATAGKLAVHEPGVFEIKRVKIDDI